MHNWDDPDIQEWKKKVTGQQQHYYDQLGDRDYDKFTSTEHKHLACKIGFALFGPPNITDENQNELSVDDYTEDQKKLILKIMEKIVAKSGATDVCVAFFFLFTKQSENHFQLPLFRVFNTETKQVFFIDHIARVYKSWKDFEEHDEMPKCIYCFPTDGMYQADDDGNVLVKFGISARCNLGERIVDVADTTSTVASIASIGLGIGSVFFPILAPAALYSVVGSGAWMVSRTAYKINDRGNHDQTLNPFADKEALNLWLSGVGGAMGLGSMGVVRYLGHLAKNGEVASKFFRITYSVLEVGNLTCNGVGIVCNLIGIIEKIKNKKLTIFEVAQFASSVAFFSHACINLKTASTIIQEVQANVLKNYESHLVADSKKDFKRICDKTVGSKKMHGNALIIRGLKHIKDPKGFFRNLSKIHKVTGSEHVVVLTDKGLIQINSELVVHPSKFVSIPNESRLKILESTGRLYKDPDYAVQFKKDVANICRTERIAFESTRTETVSSVCRRFKVQKINDIKVNGKKIFENLQPYEIDRLTSVMNNAGESDDVLKVALEFSKKVGCENFSDLCCFIEFIHAHALNGTDSFKNLPERDRLGAVLREMCDLSTGRLEGAISQFLDLRAKVAQHSATASPAFVSDNATTYHFFKHKDFDNQQLSPEEYLGKMKNLFNGKTVPKTMLTQDGDKAFFTFVDSSTGAKGVTIEPVIQSGEYTVNAVTFFYNKKLHESTI